MKVWVLLAALSLSSAMGSAAIADDSLGAETGIVYGDNHAYMVRAPGGWVLDNQSGIAQGQHAVFYPRGGDWANSPAVMYVNSASKAGDDIENVEALIKIDTIGFRSEFPDAIFYDTTAIETKDEKIAKVVCFEYTNFESVAYIEEPESISILVLTARDKESFKDAFPSFLELVKSYFFITNQVDIQGSSSK